MIKWHLYILSFLLFSAIEAELCWAESVVRWGSQTWDHARILPVGQTVIEFRGQTQAPEATRSDSTAARTQGLSALNFKQTLKDSLSSSKNSEELLELARKSNVDLNQVVAEATLEVSSVYTESQIRWSHSLTNWWMLGFNLPYVQTKTRVRILTENRAPQGQPGTMKLMQEAGSEELTIQEFRKMIADRDWDQLSEEMYYNGLGNLELMSQMRLYESRRTYFSFRNRVMVPAGSNQTAYQPVPLGPDDGQMNLGADLLMDWTPSSRFILTGVLGYTWQIQDEVEARVPNASDSRWFWEVDPDVKRDLGDIVIARLNSSVYMANQFWLTFGYEYFQKLEDSYRGSLFASEQYQRMQENTSLTRRSGRLGLRYQPRHISSAQETRSYAAGLEYISTFPSATIPRTQGASLDVQVFF